MFKFPIVSRTKIVKDLFLDKLDNIIQKIESLGVFFESSSLSNDKLDNIIQKIESLGVFFENSSLANSDHLQELGKELNALKQSTNYLLENDAFLLQASLDSVKALGDLLQEAKQQNKVLSDIYSEHQQFYNKILEEFQSSQASSLLSIKEEFQSSQASSLLAIKKSLKIIGDNNYNENIEIQLMVFLYSFLPYQRAIDIGANKGDVSVELLKAGYEVYAFEPFKPIFEELSNRLGNELSFHAFPLAIGSKNEVRELHIAKDTTESQIHGHYSLFSSINLHSLPEGLVFSDAISVEVRNLANLHESGSIPKEIGLVKIDTEGFDLEVIWGMEDYRYPVVIAEFWDSKLSFGQSGDIHKLEDLIKEMKDKHYKWYIVIYRVMGDDYTWQASYYCNSCRSVENSLGNVFFFQDYEVFSQSLKWCSAVMTATYFSI